MPHAIQIRQTGGPEVLNWTAVDVHGLKVGDRVAYAGPIGGYSEVRLIVSRISGGEKLPVVFDSVGKDTFLRSLDCLRPRGLMVTFGQASGPIDPIAPVLLSQKDSLFLTRPFLFHYMERRDALEASANELFEVVASGKVRINVNQRFALKDAAEAHKALEARATSGSTILTI